MPEIRTVQLGIRFPNGTVTQIVDTDPDDLEAINARLRLLRQEITTRENEVRERHHVDDYCLDLVHRTQVVAFTNWTEGCPRFVFDADADSE